MDFFSVKLLRVVVGGVWLLSQFMQEYKINFFLSGLYGKLELTNKNKFQKCLLSFTVYTFPGWILLAFKIPENILETVSLERTNSMHYPNNGWTHDSIYNIMSAL